MAKGRIDRKLAKRRASNIDGWACYGYRSRCMEPGCKGLPAVVIVMRVGDTLGVTTLCFEHELAAKEVLAERPRVQQEQCDLDGKAAS